jgi:hypothetical protein
VTALVLKSLRSGVTPSLDGTVGAGTDAGVTASGQVGTPVAGVLPPPASASTALGHARQRTSCADARAVA